MINPLEHFIHIALCNLQLLESDYYQGENTKVSKQISETILSYIPLNIKSFNNNTIGYKTIELAGIAKFFDDIHQDESQEVVYENTLGMTIHGIDAITRDKSGAYTIYEIKGTMRKLRSPRSYLKKTRRRDRQLTWEWCWASLVDMAEFPLTASVFLALYADVIEQRVKRKLAIVECQKEKDGSYLGYNIHISDFDVLNIKEDYNMKKQKHMLDSLKERKVS